MTRDHLEFARKVADLLRQRAGLEIGPSHDARTTCQGSEALQFDVLDSSIPPMIAYRVYITEPRA